MFGNRNNMPNMGMNMLNWGVNMPYMGMNNPNMGMNKPNMGMNNPNMGMNNPNMGMNNSIMGMNMPNMRMNMPNMGIGMPELNMNMPIQGMNIGGYEEWMKGYQMGYNEVMNEDKDNNQPPVNPTIDKINIVFNTTQGMTKIIPIERGKTMSEAIKTYLNRVGKPELFNRTNDICFLCNGNKIDIHCNVKVEQYFMNYATPKIIVNDVKNLIGAKKIAIIYLY